MCQGRVRLDDRTKTFPEDRRTSTTAAHSRRPRARRSGAASGKAGRDAAARWRPAHRQHAPPPASRAGRGRSGTSKGSARSLPPPSAASLAAALRRARRPGAQVGGGMGSESAPPAAESRRKRRGGGGSRRCRRCRRCRHCGRGSGGGPAELPWARPRRSRWVVLDWEPPGGRPRATRAGGGLGPAAPGGRRGLSFAPSSGSPGRACVRVRRREQEGGWRSVPVFALSPAARYRAMPTLSSPAAPCGRRRSPRCRVRLFAGGTSSPANAPRSAERSTGL